MEKSAITGLIRFEIDSDAAPGERPESDARPPLSLAVGPQVSQTVQSVEDAGPPRPRSPLPISIRPARLSDLVALRGVRARVQLNQPDELLLPRGASWAVMSSSWPWSKPRPHVFVATSGDRLVGTAQFETVLPDQRWVLTGIGAATGVYDPAPIWEELVARAVVAAGLNGVKRLFARVDERSDVNEVLRAVGFVAYATETVLVARDLTSRRGSASLRRQEASDTWAIHQLYNAAVPRQVQYAEAYTSHRWDLDPKRRRDRIPVVSGWLIEEGHYVLGYARVATRGGSHVLELVCHPERQDVLGDLVDGALARLAAQGGRRVYCAVRGYQTEAATALEQAGFSAVMEQHLYLKYTTANVRLPVFEALPLHVEVREKLPKRVPSFLHGQPRDESAT
jgi:hypothetical protein